MDGGNFGRHIRRMRALYAERADALANALRLEIGGRLSFATPTVGMHLIGWLPSDADANAISLTARSLGIEARALTLYGTDVPHRPALVLGFGALATKDAGPAVVQLARAVRGEVHPGQAPIASAAGARS